MKTRTYVYESDKLAIAVASTIKLIREHVLINDYQVKGELKFTSNDMDQLKLVLAKSSKNYKKKLNTAIYRVRKNTSLRNINRFLWLAYREVSLKSKPKISISIKEQSIQATKKKWIVARDHAEKLLLEYKTEKGDFYKKKIKNLEKVA